MVLLDKARDLVLPGGHGRVGGVVARVQRSVAVNIGRGENLFYFGLTRDGEARSILEGVAATLAARRVALGGNPDPWIGRWRRFGVVTFLVAPPWSPRSVVCSFSSSRWHVHG